MLSEPQPLLQHLGELRNRLLLCVAFFGVVFLVCYYFAPQLYQLLLHPLAEQAAMEGRRLIYTGLAEAFLTYLQLALWCASLLTLPFLLVQGWLFAAPGLYAHERQAFWPLLLAVPVMFSLGAALAYFFVIPVAWHFFLSFEMAAAVGQLPIQLEARVSEYLNLATGFIIAFGVAFLLPVLLVLLVRAGVLQVAQLRQFRRYAIVLNFVVAAVLTPPDVLSQLMLAVPLCLLYEVAILAATILERRARPESAVVLSEKHD